MNDQLQSDNQRIVVTGIGIYAPQCADASEFAELLRSGKTGIQEHRDVLEDKSVWAGIISDHSDSTAEAPKQLASFDRTAQMGWVAAKQAIDDSQFNLAENSDRVALTLGTSHGGRSQFDQFVLNNCTAECDDVPRKLLVTAAHYQQTAAVASMLNIHGPTATLSNACSSSGAAIAYGVELLRSGKCDLAVTGGADGFSRLTFAGFSALGAVADGPCAPFSEPVGLSLGDGAGFVVLETLESARRRDAKIYAELWGYGLSWDAYHITAPEPSGEGMNRAIKMAVERSDIAPSEIDYVNVHGTGTRSNDLAETVGLLRYFGDNPPPVSATKSQTGHMLGASSAVGVISCILGMNDGWLPPTANYTTQRSGCELDAIPNKARPADWSCFMAQSAAFAGANAVVIGGKVRETSPTKTDAATDELVITGVGIVSPLGCGFETFADAVNNSTSGIADITEFDVQHCRKKTAGMVRDFKPRKIMPSLKLRRVDRVAAFATISASLALKHADCWPLESPDRLGLVVGVCRGASTSYEKYLASVEGSQWHKASAVYFPNLVMSSVGGQVSASLGIQGITSSLVGGTAAGLQAFIHATELFRRNANQDRCIVLASDELAPFYYRLLDRRDEQDQPNSAPLPLGEGSAAFVIERASAASARGAKVLATIRGTGLSSDGADAVSARSAPGDANPVWLTRAYQAAITEAQLQAADIGRVYTSLQGRTHHDTRETTAICDAVGDVPQHCVNELTGVAEASSSLFNLAAAIATKPDDSENVLLSATGDDGANASVVLRI